MPISDLYPPVVRDIIMHALLRSPELLSADAGANRRVALAADIAGRIANELAANGFLPPDARLEESIVFSTVDYVVRRIPEAALRNRKQSWYMREDWLNSPGAAVSRCLIKGLEERGFLITKSFVSPAPHGSNFGPRREAGDLSWWRQRWTRRWRAASAKRPILEHAKARRR